MAIEVICPAGHSFTVSEKYAGKRGKCPHCGAGLSVPTNLGDTKRNAVVEPTVGGKPQSRNSENRTSDSQTGRKSKRKSIGRFQLKSILGQGAFGTVYRAYDPQLDRHVALKVPRVGSLVDEDDIQRFLREARSAAQLRHPHIVPVYEAGKFDNTYYIASGFVEGQPLANWINSGERYAHEQVASLIRKLASALHYAHNKGVIHRDLKPANIMIDKEGEPHIMDFGLARRSEGDGLRTREGMVMGTPAYMSPEQAMGQSHLADARSDLWSLGIILYELLTGQRPFRGSETDIIIAVRVKEPPAPRALDTSIPMDLDTICRKCLEKKPEERYPSCQHLTDELERWRRGDAIQSRPISPLERAWRWAKRNPAMASLTGAVAAAVLLVAVLGVSIAIIQARSNSQLRTLLEQAESEKKRADKNSIQAQKNLAQAERLRQQENAAREATIKEKMRADEKAKEAQKASKKLLFTLADMYTYQGLGASQRNNYAQAALYFSHAASQVADLDQARMHANLARVRACLPRLHKPVHAFQTDGPLLKLAFGNRGRYLAAVSVRGICRCWDLNQGKSLSISTLTSNDITSMAWHPQESVLAVGTVNGDVFMLNVPDGNVLEKHERAQQVTALAFSKDGRRLAFADTSAAVWDLQRRRLMIDDLPHPDFVQTFGFSTTGERLVTGCRDNLARVYDITENGNGRLLFDPMEHYCPRIVRDPRNRRPVAPRFVRAAGKGPEILLTVSQSRLKWWNAVNGRLLASTEVGHHMAFADHPESSHLAASRDKSVQLWNKSTHESIGVSLGHEHDVFDVSISPDGSKLISTSMDNTARIWAIPSGDQIGQTLLHENTVHLGAFSPKGQSVATAQADGIIRIWQLKDEPKAGFHVATAGIFSSAKFGANGQYVFACGNSYKNCQLRGTRVYDTATGRSAGPEISPGGIIIDAEMDPSRSRLAICVSAGQTVAERKREESGTLQFWDWKSGRKVGESVAMPSEPRSVAFSIDGDSVFVLCIRGEIVKIDARTGLKQAHAQHAQIRPFSNNWTVNGLLRISPDGSRLVSCGLDSVARIWSSQTLTPLFGLRHEGWCSNAKFSRDSRWVVTTAFDNTARVWDLNAGGSEVQVLRHPDWLFGATFNADSNFVLTACRDKLARVWNWHTGELSCAPFEHSNELTSAEFLGDGLFAMTASIDKTARVWDTKTGHPVTSPTKLSFPATHLRVSKSGEFAVVSGLGKEFHVISNRDLLRVTELPSINYELWSEILASRRIAGAGAVRLTSAEWLARWSQWTATAEN